ASLMQSGISPMNAVRSSHNSFSLVAVGRLILVIASLGLLPPCLIACGIRSTPGGPPIILLFNGSGTSPNDVAAFEKILDENHYGYAEANSRQLNGMSESQLRAYRLLIVPGGNFEQIGNGLTPNATANIRNAVHGGLNYLGICAGAFLAGDSP